jgi:hypothetical protein
LSSRLAFSGHCFGWNTADDSTVFMPRRAVPASPGGECCRPSSSSRSWHAPARCFVRTIRPPGAFCCAPNTCAANNTLHFGANENTKTISVTINGDTKVESNETFNVLLSNATNGATISDPQGVGTITNDDVLAVTPTIATFSNDSETVGDGITNDNTLTLSGTASANSAVRVFEGTTQVGQTTANGGGAWSVTTAALADGSHSFTATSTTGGTTSASSSPLSVRVDTVAPSAPTIASFSTDTGTVGDGITSDNTLTLTGVAAANSAVKVYDGSMLLGTATANSSGVWS